MATTASQMPYGVSGVSSVTRTCGTSGRMMPVRMRNLAAVDNSSGGMTWISRCSRSRQPSRSTAATVNATATQGGSISAIGPEHIGRAGSTPGS